MKNNYLVLSWTVFLSLAAAVFFGAIFLLLLYETWALQNDKPPITQVTRAAIDRYKGPAFVVAFLIGALFGHFYWP